MSRFHSSKHFKRFSSTEEFEFLSELGKGGYSVVYLVKHKMSGKKYALKCAMKYKKGKDRSDRAREEIKILSSLKHDNIIKLKGFFEDEDTIYLVLEYVSGGDLAKNYRKTLPNKEIALKIMYQLIEGVKYCHKKGIIHRDIKMENVLIDHNLNIKLTDFGLATYRQNGKYLYDEVGTPRYTAPELLSGDGYDGSVDVWGIGVILFLLIIGSYPFDGSNRKNIFTRIVEKRIDYTKYNLSNEEEHILKRLLCKNPRYRIRLDDITDTPWFCTFREDNQDDESNDNEENS